MVLRPVDGFPIKVVPKEELDRMPVYGMHLSADFRSGHSTHGTKPSKVKRPRDKNLIHAPEPESAPTS